jgi:LysR family transcriptional regulator for metE and metH
MSLAPKHPRLELRHLRTLVTIRDTGGIARAARRLHLTQSALSHQLKAMEDQCGGQLLVRKSRPPRFTPGGQRLLKLADEVLPRIEVVEKELRNLSRGDAGRLYIAIECHSCFDWLLPVMDRYREQWPEVEMDLSLAHSLDPLPALIEHSIDLVITSDPLPHPAVAYSPLFRYQALLIMARDHPLAGRRRIRPADLAGETILTYPVARQRLDIFRRYLEPAGVEPAGVRTAELTSILVQLAANQRGVAALPGWAIDKYLREGHIVARPLGPRGLWATLYTAVRHEQADLPYLRDFTRLARRLSLATLEGVKPAR